MDELNLWYIFMWRNDSNREYYWWNDWCFYEDLGSTIEKKEENK